MLFNLLCEVAEKYIPQIRPLLEMAVLLEFPVKPHEVLPKQIAPLERVTQAAVSFSLPYPIVAIQDLASLVVLCDTQQNQTGLAEDRVFIECVPLMADENAFNDDPAIKQSIQNMQQATDDQDKDAVAVTIGTIASPAQRTGEWLARGSVKDTWVASSRRLLTSTKGMSSVPGALMQQMTQASLRNAMTAMEEIMLVPSLPKFECWPPAEDPLLQFRHTRIRRTSERAMFTLDPSGRISKHECTEVQ